MIGLIGAMDVEIEQLADLLEDREDERIGLDIFMRGRLFGREAVLAVCGPGKVNAALCAQSMIMTWRPEWILNLGVAGSGAPAAGIGDLVIAAGAVQHDMDTSPIGDPVGYISKVGRIVLPCDEALRRLLRKAAETVPGVRVHEGIIATGDQFINRGDLRGMIHERFEAMAVEMEGAAVAQACFIHGVPCGILRSISDNANGESDVDYPTFRDRAAAQTQQVIRALLSEVGA
ncbi:MAG: 5'-methylthioadenosine/adenosylhomocysteine nucleosidase [Clostridia bacterium]|nr:5'-methylthioadenosine/adenosylhomocysteine nucleosidase [Clostridia bacterium]